MNPAQDLHCSAIARCRTALCSSAPHVLYAVTAAMLVFAWQYFVVSHFHRGNWTALFNTGTIYSPPKSLQSENIATVSGTGYDGQFYHYVAHDPLLRDLSWRNHFDSYAYRYGKILVPALAHIAAGGRTEYIDAAYVAVTLLFVGLGAYSLSIYSASRGHTPATGLLFLFVPATMLSVDNLTIDVALAALTVSFVVALERGWRKRLFPILAAAPLVRETGVILLIAYAVFGFRRRCWKNIGIVASAALPWVGWLAYVRARAGPMNQDMPVATVSGVVTAFHTAVAQSSILGVLDFMVVAGIIAASLLAILQLKDGDTVAIAGALFAALAALQQGRLDLWENYHALGRVFSPLLVLVALHRVTTLQRWLLFATVMLVLPRHLLRPAAMIVSALVSGQ